MTNIEQKNESFSYDYKKVDRVGLILIWVLIVISIVQSYFRAEDVLAAALESTPVGLLAILLYFLKLPRFLKSLLFGIIPAAAVSFAFFIEPFSVDRHYMLCMTVALVALYFTPKLVLAFGGFMNALYIAMFVLVPEQFLGADSGVPFFLSIFFMLNGQLVLMYFLTRWGRAIIEKISKSQSDMNALLEQLQAAGEQDKRQMAYQQAEVQKVLTSLERLSKGELSCDIQLSPPDDSMREAYDLFRNIADKLGESVGIIRGYIAEITNVLGRVAQGNLRARIESDYRGDFTALKEATNDIAGKLGDVIEGIRVAAQQVNAGAAQVSGRNMNASQNVGQQADKIEMLTASVTEIAERTKQNAEQASHASQLTEAARTEAEAGNDRMQGLRQAMEEIGEASQSIGGIIKTIEDIAFQTNILALNAAVEAARAGSHGKGFAVVADEVRSLANRSAEAAGKTGELISRSAEKTQAGVKLVGATAETLSRIVAAVEQAAALVGEIAVSCGEQATGIMQVNFGFGKMSQIVQENAASAQEMAAVSEELSSQAEALSGMVGQFSV